MNIARLVLVARLQPGARQRAQELIADDGQATGAEPSLDRLGVFLADDEVVFFLESEGVEEILLAFLDDPVRSTVIARWLPLFDGPLHAAHEVYFWERGTQARG